VTDDFEDETAPETFDSEAPPETFDPQSDTQSFISVRTLVQWLISFLLLQIKVSPY